MFSFLGSGVGGVQRPCGSPSSCLSGLQPAAYRLPLCSQLSWSLRTERGMSQDWSGELGRSGFNVCPVVCYSTPLTVLPLTCRRSHDVMGITDRGLLGRYLYVMIGWLIFGQAPLLPCAPSPEMRDNGPMCVCANFPGMDFTGCVKLETELGGKNLEFETL